MFCSCIHNIIVFFRDERESIPEKVKVVDISKSPVK